MKLRHMFRLEITGAKTCDGGDGEEALGDNSRTQPVGNVVLDVRYQG